MQIVTQRHAVEPIHLAAVDRDQPGIERVSEVVGVDVRRRGERDGRSQRQGCCRIAASCRRSRRRRPDTLPKQLSNEWFSLTRKIACLIGLSGPTCAGVGLEGPGLAVVGERLFRALVAPPLEGQNCQAATRNATTNTAALPDARRAVDASDRAAMQAGGAGRVPAASRGVYRPPSGTARESVSRSKRSRTARSRGSGGQVPGCSGSSALR